jgi:mono/diheme cytochrome c family protein
MKSIVHVLGAVALAAALGAGLLAAGQNAPSGNAANGKQLFEKQNCYYCHGTAGQGGRDGARIAATALTVAQFTRYVRRPAGAMRAMPAYTAKLLTDEQLADVYAYLKTLPAAQPPAQIPILDRSR